MVCTAWNHQHTLSSVFAWALTSGQAGSISSRCNYVAEVGSILTGNNCLSPTHNVVDLFCLQGDLGLNIREAHVFNTTDGFALDVFVVDGWNSDVSLGAATHSISAVLSRGYATSSMPHMEQP